MLAIQISFRKGVVNTWNVRLAVALVAHRANTGTSTRHFLQTHRSVALA